MMKIMPPLALLSALLMPAAAAFAHPGTQAGFMQGLSHPLGGVDHLLAMVAVGVLASRLQGMKRIALPAAFIFAMIAGGVLGASGVVLPWVEVAIAASLVAFGLSIASGRESPVAAMSLMVGCFGLFHGHAHGTEMVGSSLLVYGAGFVIATSALHAIGLTLTVRLHTFGERARIFVRASGGALAATGVALLALTG
jgi:urease accessory protein